MMNAATFVVYLIFIASAVCSILILYLRRAWGKIGKSQGYLIFPFSIAALWALWSATAIYYRTFITGGQPSPFISYWASINILTTVASLTGVVALEVYKVIGRRVVESECSG